MTVAASSSTGVSGVRPRAGVASAFREHARLWALLAVVVVWVAIWAVMQGKYTLEISTSSRTDVHDWLQKVADDISAASDSNGFVAALNSFADALNSAFEWLQNIFTVAKFPRPLPEIGWLGTIAIAAWVTFAAAGWRSVCLVVPAFLAFGFLGYWTDSVDTLLLVGVSVAIACLVGIPLCVWMGRNRVVTAIVTPVLDVMQTMPSFVYLLPFVVFSRRRPRSARTGASGW